MKARAWRNIANALLVSSLAIGFSACESVNFDGMKQNLGMVFGAGAGALAGSQIGSGAGQLVAVAIGTLAGAWAGSEIGKKMDHADKVYAEKVTQTALKRNQDGAASPWDNARSGNSGTIMPTKTFRDSGGKRCREFVQTISIDGEETTATGRACELSDGSWRIVPAEK